MSVYERVQDGETLWDDPAFLESLLENTSEGILTIDAESRIVFATPAVEDVLGYRPEELIGRPKMEVIPERLRPVHQRSLERYVDTGEKHIDWGGFEVTALHKHGHEVPISVSLREHEYEGERLFTGIFTDISDRKRRERELEERTRELEEFAGVLSHDLRNPLSVAQGYTELANEQYHGDELERVETALDRMEEIIEDMLARTRRDTAESREGEPVDLRATIDEAWESVLAPYAKIELPDTEWTVDAQRARLKQLAENLFRNAVEHGGEDVTVRVGVLDEGNGFYVEDDGIGLPEEFLGRTWLPGEPSLTSDDGYGLYIVERIAGEHG